MTAQERQRPPGEPAGESHDHQGNGIKVNANGPCPTCAATSSGTIWRVKYYRPGWVDGLYDAQIRYFARGYHARLFANKVANSYPTQAGHAIVEVSVAQRDDWQVVDR